MEQKFFSVELYNSKNGEIVSIVTSTQLGPNVSTFDEIQDYCIEEANIHQCKGAVRNEFGIKVLDFNYSPSCEYNICFCYDENLLQDFIKAHPERKTVSINPVMEQFKQFKEKYPEAILLFRCGDFYEAYEDDAQICAKTLGITLTRRGSEGTRMAGFPHHALDIYLPKLVRAGYRIAICDKLENQRTNKTIQRGITELVTPNIARQ